MKAIIIVAGVTLWIAGANVQGLSPEEIAAAIEQGKAGKALQKKCSGVGDNAIDIVAEGPIGRIMRAAREAKRQNEDFTAADVPAKAGQWLTVTATRVPALHKPNLEYLKSGIGSQLEYRTYFVVRSKAPRSEQAIVLEPLGPIRNVLRDSSPLPSNLPAMPGGDITASFDFAAFKAIRHKDVEVVVFMTDTGEQKCKISEKDRQALK